MSKKRQWKKRKKWKLDVPKLLLKGGRWKTAERGIKKMVDRRRGQGRKHFAKNQLLNESKWKIMIKKNLQQDLRSFLWDFVSLYFFVISIITGWTARSLVVADFKRLWLNYPINLKLKWNSVTRHFFIWN